MKTIIIDNFLDNADWLSNYAETLDYRSRGPNEYFEGKRSPELHTERKTMADSICTKIIESYYNVRDYSYKAELYFHKTTESDLKDPQWKFDKIHTDEGIIAGLIYLSKGAPIDCGTQTYNQDKPDIIMGNQYNRLVVYPCKKPHSAMNYFNSRLVLLFWLYELNSK